MFDKRPDWGEYYLNKQYFNTKAPAFSDQGNLLTHLKAIYSSVASTGASVTTINLALILDSIS